MSNKVQEMVDQATETPTVEVLPAGNGNGKALVHNQTFAGMSARTADQAMIQVASVKVEITEEMALAMWLKATQKAINAVCRQAAEDRLGLRPAGTKRK